MKYVITGSLGNISKSIVEKLVKARHEVVVVSHDKGRVKAIEEYGAKAAIGSVEDVVFLTQAFKGADAVYIMVPPNFGAKQWKKHIADIGKNYAEAIKKSGVKYVVNLSSIGAHMPEGCGPVSGLHQVERSLNDLADVNVKHLRPGFFYNNFYANIGMIKHAGIIGGNYGQNTRVVMADPSDIAAVAAEELSSLSFSGKSIRYVVSDEKTTTEIAQSLGKAIGKNDLPWVDFKDEDAFNGMKQAGLPEEIAKNYVEMGTALRSGEMIKDYLSHKPAALGKVKLDDFAKAFSRAYQQA
jgi:uncharacterized protein YbjT (DUF2867 family)